MNTVVETAEQVRQTFRPKQPRVEIDMTYVQGEPDLADANDHAQHNVAQLAATQPPHGDPDPSPADGAVGGHCPADDAPSYADALTELAALRELAEVFESEFDKELSLRTAVEAELDDARRQAAVATREIEAARAELAARPAALVASEDPEAPGMRSRIAELSAEIKREQESRLALLAQLESSRQQVRDAHQNIADLREAAAKATMLPAVAMPAMDQNALQEQLEILQADFQAELLAEQSTRRATEAQRDLAERRVAAAQRELDNLRPLAAQAGSVAGLEAKLATVDAERAALARHLDETKSSLAAIERDAAAHVAAASEALAAAQRDAETQREIVRRIALDLKNEVSARAALADKAEQAAQRVAELERDLAQRESNGSEALAAARRDAAVLDARITEITTALAAEQAAVAAERGRAEAAERRNGELQRDHAARDASSQQALDAARKEAEDQRALADKIAADLAAERESRSLVDSKAAQAAQQIAQLQQKLSARDATDSNALTAVRQEAAAQRALADQIATELVEEQAARVSIETKLAHATRQFAELQQKFATRDATAGQELSATQQEAEAQRAAVDKLEADLAIERAARAAAETKLETAMLQVTDAQQQLAERSAEDQDNAAGLQDVDAMRTKATELEAALATEISARGEAEAELAQTSFRLSELQGKLTKQGETIDRLEARLRDNEAATGGQNADAAATALRIAELEAESDANARAIDTAMQEAARQRGLAVQLAAELKGEKAALDAIAGQLAAARLRAAELERERDSGDHTASAPVNNVSSLVNAVGAIPPKAVIRPASSALVLTPSKVPPTARIDLELEANAAHDDTLAADASAPLLSRAQSILKSGPKAIFESDTPEGRRERRTAAQSPATVWRDGMSQALSCMIRNRSSGGALLEFPADRHGDEITDFSIGDELTLTFTSYRERSSVTCIVARIDGRTCGVKFAGQFHVQMLKPAKPKKPLGKPELAKAGR